MADNPLSLSITKLFYHGGLMDANLKFIKSTSPNCVKHRVKYGNAAEAMTMAVDFANETLPAGTYTTVTVPGLDPMLPWFFQVYAVNAFDVESTGSNTINTATAPSAPTGLSLVSLV